MTDQNEFDDETLKGQPTKKSKTGTDDGAAGTGMVVARFSAQGTTVKPLSGAKKQEVMRAFEYLDVAKAMARVAEFFSELPARASANLAVNFTNVKGHSYALVNHVISFGTEVSQLMRERTAQNVKRLRTRFGIKVPARNTSTPTAGPGMV